MSRNELTHTALGIELVRKLAGEGLRVFTAAQARRFAPAVGLSEGYFRQALHHLANSGWLVRLRKGLYALSSTTPGVTAAHEFEIAMSLVSPAAISHWSAMHYHGLTEQAPRKVFVLTTRGSRVPRTEGGKAAREEGGCRVGEAVYRFIQVEPERFFGTESIWVGDARVTITDPERTLLDGLMKPQHCGDFAEVRHSFEARRDGLDLKRIIEYALKLDAATVKRLGWVLEKQGVGPVRLRPLAKVPIKGYRRLDPTGPRKGPCCRRWMIQENLPGLIGHSLGAGRKVTT